MSAPRKPKTPLELRQASGVKSLLVGLFLVLVMVWSVEGLDVAGTNVATGKAWSNMADLVIRMGPMQRIRTCNNANVIWGNDDPWAGKPNPDKVRAVCEDKQILYWYDRDLLDEQFEYVKVIWEPLMQTFQMALIGAGAGALLAIPFSLLAAQNIVRFKPLYYFVRFVLGLIRTIPELVLASVMVASFGLGALPGILSIAVFSFALIAKLTSETIESIDPGPQEAIQACGGNTLQQISYGVIPQILPQYLAYSLYVLEISVRASTVLGLVGAGGVGALLKRDLDLGMFRNVGVIIMVMLLAVTAIDVVSTKLRERLI
jgi:phosphonate transport system permease protein